MPEAVHNVSRWLALRAQASPEAMAVIDDERAAYWLSKGAQPSDAVRKLLEISGALGARPKKIKDPKVHVVDEAAQVAAAADDEAVKAAAASAAELAAAAAAEVAAEVDDEAVEVAAAATDDTVADVAAEAEEAADDDKESE